MRLRIEYLPSYDRSWGDIKKAHDTDAGFDLRTTEDVWIAPQSFTSIPLGIKTEFPEGYEAQLRARSGISKSFGIGLTNGVGTIDAGYRGEWRALFSNPTPVWVQLKRGDRVCQVVFNKLPDVEIEEGSVSDNDNRGGGFGSTGVK